MTVQLTTRSGPNRPAATIGGSGILGYVSVFVRLTGSQAHRPTGPQAYRPTGPWAYGLLVYLKHILSTNYYLHAIMHWGN